MRVFEICNNLHHSKILGYTVCYVEILKGNGKGAGVKHKLLTFNAIAMHLHRYFTFCITQQSEIGITCITEHYIGC